MHQPRCSPAGRLPATRFSYHTSFQPPWTAPRVLLVSRERATDSIRYPKPPIEPHDYVARNCEPHCQIVQIGDIGLVVALQEPQRYGVKAGGRARRRLDLASQ